MPKTIDPLLEPVAAEGYLRGERRQLEKSTGFRHQANSERQRSGQRLSQAEGLDVYRGHRRLCGGGRIDRRLVVPATWWVGGNTVPGELNQINPIYVYFNISEADLAA